MPGNKLTTRGARAGEYKSSGEYKESGRRIRKIKERTLLIVYSSLIQLRWNFQLVSIYDF